MVVMEYNRREKQKEKRKKGKTEGTFSRTLFFLFSI